MPLRREQFPVPFGIGLDTKTDPKLVVPGKLLELQNGVFDVGGAVKKRNGYRRVSGAAGSAQAGFSFGNEIDLCSGGRLQSYAQAGDTWIDKGALRSVGVQVSDIIRNENQQTYPDCASANGVTVYAYEAGGNAVHAIVVDEATGTVIGNDKLVGVGYSPRCVTCDGKISIFYLHTTADFVPVVELRRVVVDAHNPSATWLSNVVLSNVEMTEQFYAVAADPTNKLIALVYNTAGTNRATLRWLTSSGVTTNQPFAPTHILPQAVAGLDVCFSPSAGVFVAVSGTVNTIDIARIQETGIVESVESAPFAGDQITAVTVGEETDPTYTVYAEFASKQVKAAKWTSGGALSFSSFYRSVTLGARAFSQGGRSHVGLAYTSDLQGTWLLAASDGTIVSRNLAGRGGIAGSKSYLPSAAALDSNTRVLAIPSKGPLHVMPGYVISTRVGLSRVTLDFKERFRRTALGASVQVAGGAPSSYDGTRTFEHGFHVFPEGFLVGESAIKLALTSGGQGNANPQQTVVITPPPDVLSRVPEQKCGSRIRPGSYLWLGNASRSNPVYVWFTVDGVGTDPAPCTADNTVQPANGASKCALLSTDDQTVVAQKLYRAISAFKQGIGHDGKNIFTTTINTDNTIQVVYALAPPPGESTDKPGPPSLDCQMTAQIVRQATLDVNSNSALQQFVFPAGKWIASGQSFRVTSSSLQAITDPLQTYVFYFVVDGITPSPVPAPLGGAIASVPVAVASTDSPSTVRAASATAIVGTLLQGQPLWTISSVNGAQLVLACTVGRRVLEGLHAYEPIPEPEIVDVGGNIGAGLYEYRVTYRWTDAQGQVYRSKPSAPVNALISPARSVNFLTIPTLRLTQRADVVIEVWRTIADQTTLHLVTTLANDTTIDSIAWTDNVKDTDLKTAEILYTTGGVLPCAAPRPSTILLNHRNRLFLVDAEDNTLIRPSREFAAGEGVAFADELSIRVEGRGGAVTALASLDEKVVVFKADRIYAFSGDGPDDTGSNGDWTEPELISSDAGCTNPDSVAVVPRGIMFQSKKGIYLLDRGGQVVPLGVPVAALIANSGPVTSATLHTTLQQVRFCFAGDLGLSYDYYYDQWGQMTGHAAVDAFAWNDLHVMIRPDGSLRIETPGQYQDANSNVTLKVTTAWLQPFGPQAWGRLYAFLFLGKWASGHDLQVDLAFDFRADPEWTSIFDPTASINGTGYGQDGNYGQGSPYGGTADGVYQFRGRLGRKFEAVRFTFTDVAPLDGGASFEISSLVLSVASKSMVKGLPSWKQANGG